MRLGRLLPRYRMGTGLLFDSYDVDRWARLYLNPNYVTIADLARMTGLARGRVQRQLAPFRATLAIAGGDPKQRIGALYDLDNPVLQHLFALWGWDKRIAQYQKENQTDVPQDTATDPRQAAANASGTSPRPNAQQGSTVENWLLATYRPRRAAARVAKKTLERNERSGIGE